MRGWRRGKKKQPPEDRSKEISEAADAFDVALAKRNEAHIRGATWRELLICDLEVEQAKAGLRAAVLGDRIRYVE